MEDLIKILNIIKEWQTLVGVLVGSFIGAWMSLMGLYFRDIFKEMNRRKEGRRRIEISSTRALNDIITVKMNLFLFITRTEKIIEEINKFIDDDSKFVLSDTNFPHLKIFLDPMLPEIVTKSYYVHNKILGIDTGVKVLNDSLIDLKQNFPLFFKKNEFLVVNQASKREQKETYRGNLKDFNILIKENLISNSIDVGMKTLMQLKVYNSKMRGRWGWYMRWKYERVDFKYFRGYKEISNYNQELTCIERIDELIESEVLDMLKKGAEKIGK